MIYLDHNATTALRAEAMDAMVNLWQQPLNASSVHAYGKHAARTLNHVRQQLLGTVRATDHQVIFTSSGTEANNLALKRADYEHVFVSSIEHPSVLKARDRLVHIPVDKSGVILVGKLKEKLQESAGKGKKILVSVMLANNETGVIQPVQHITQLAKAYGAVVHTDAVQMLGKMPINISQLGVDMMSVSGHKCGGPLGVGALIFHPSLEVQAQMLGGGQEYNKRAGTQNVLAIHGFGAVLKLPLQTQEVQKLRDYLEIQVLQRVPEAVIFGKDVERLPNTSCISMPGVDSQTQVIEFDLQQIAVSAGAACSSGKISTSHVLQAMGAADAVARSAIRVSLGDTNTKTEIDRFVDVWYSLYRRVKK